MKVRLTTDRVGNDFVQRRGEVLDLPAAEARRLVAAGQAEPVKNRSSKKEGQDQ